VFILCLVCAAQCCLCPCTVHSVVLCVPPNVACVPALSILCLVCVTQCCLCPCTVHFWLPFWCSLTFIYIYPSPEFSDILWHPTKIDVQFDTFSWSLGVSDLAGSTVFATINYWQDHGGEV
jgi:hypothetical protein